jgi:hypothetical protein
MISNAIECRRGGDEIDRIFQKDKIQKSYCDFKFKEKVGMAFYEKRRFFQALFT